MKEVKKIMQINGREIKPYKITRTAEEIANITGTEPKTVIVDFDDTLVLSTPRQIQLILESKNLPEYCKYLNLREMSDRFILDRNEYYTWKWLKRKDVDEVPQHIIEEVTNFFNVPNFYDGVKPTKYAQSLKHYINQKYCKKIYVVSHCLSDASIDAKVNWLADFFKDSPDADKIEFIPTKDTNKSVPIIDMGIEWDVFADDRLECIYDMVLYGQGFGNEILIPRCGYNKPDERFTNLVEKFNLQTFYMDVL